MATDRAAFATMTNSAPDHAANPHSAGHRKASALPILFSIAVLLVAAVPYFWSIFLAIVELGDPPFTENDTLQRDLLIAWLLLFAAALAISALSHHRLVFRIFAFVVALLTLFGLFWVL